MERVESGPPGVGGPWLVRPRFLLPAIVALVAAVASLLVNRVSEQWQPAVGSLRSSTDLAFVPLCVFACRYYELARFTAVRRSGWALACAVAAAVMLFVMPSFEEFWRSRLLFIYLLLAMTVSLFARQRQLQRSGGEGTQPDWPFGGLLALVGAIALDSGFGLMRAESGPWEWAIGLGGITVLWLQTRRHVWFPALACIWVLGQVTRSYVTTFNLYFLLGFPLATLTTRGGVYGSWVPAIALMRRALSWVTSIDRHSIASPARRARLVT